MASLVHAIHAFQNGGLTHNEFFAQVDRVLATDQANSARLLEILGEEHTRILLPPDVYDELQRRIKKSVKSNQDANDQTSGIDATPMQLNPGDRMPPRPGSRDGSDDQAVAELDRMKGVGDTLNGRFVLEECIGFGGMGTVYKALDLRKLEASDRKPYIAIKVLNVQFRGHPKSLIALQREAKKAQTLAHPNIVTVYDFDRDGSMVYLTMEYLSGKPLSRMLRAPDFTGVAYAKALHIVSGIAKALAYAHERGFVHCDLKPANVFLTDTGEVKVIDFGIARVFRKPEEEIEATVFDAGSLGGLTPAYASPEMLEHLVPDPRDDIYALACITYELLTGRHPFDRVSATQARNAGMKPQRPKDIGNRQWRALRSALSFDRITRTPTIARFLQDMGETSGGNRTATYIALATSGLTIALLVTAAVSYYWKPQGGRDDEPAAPAAPAISAAPGAPSSTPAPSTPATPAVAPVPPIASAPVEKPAPAPPPVLPRLSIAAVTPILARVPCSALAASASDHTLQVNGYLSRGVGAARLKDMLGAVPGLKTLNLDVQQVSDDKCAVINTFAPYWARNRQAGGHALIRTRESSGELQEGDPLIVDITTPAYDSYVYVDYFVLDGNVAHLVPNKRARPNQAPPNYAATIGSMGNWVVSKPFGSELIVLLVTPAPLFDGVRPDYESRADYLRALEKELGQLAGKYGPERISADFVQITTKARKP